MLKCKILIKLFKVSFMLVCCGHSSWESVDWDSDWWYWQILSQTSAYTKFTQMQDEVFTSHLALNSHMNHTEPHCAQQDRSEGNHVEPNHFPHCHIVIWDFHSSELLHSFEWKFLADVLGQLIDPIFKGQNIQMNRAWLKLTDTSCLVLCPLSV